MCEEKLCDLIFQLLLRGSAQREPEQRAQLLDSSKISKIPKNQEKHLTLRQRRLLLLGTRIPRNLISQGTH